MHKEPSRNTGPNTPEGKANSSKNSIKHGLRSNPVNLLPGETQEGCDAVRDIWLAEYDSEHPGTACLLEPLINDDRLVRLSHAVIAKAYRALAEAEAAPEPDQTRLEWLHKDLQTKLRYKTQHERSFQRSLRNIEQFGKRRVREAQAVHRLLLTEQKIACDVAVKLNKHGLDYREVLPFATSAPLPGVAQPEPPVETTPPLL